MIEVQFAISRADRHADANNVCSFRSPQSEFYMDKDSDGKYLHGKREDGRSVCGASLFLTPHRMTKDKIDLGLWNHIVHCDVDCYKYYDTHEGSRDKVPFVDLCEELQRVLSEMYPRNFYCFQKSSHDGIHVYFYYGNQSLTKEEDFNAVQHYVVDCIGYAFECMGLEDMYNYGGVMDECTKSPYQYTFWTPTKVYYNTSKCDNYGTITYEEWCDILSKYDVAKPKFEKKFDYSYDFKCDRLADGVKVGYLDHFKRWQLFDSLSCICRNIDSLKSEWEYCAEHISENERHSTEQYKKMPFGVMDWCDKLSGNETANRELLSMFGYSVRKFNKGVNLDYLKNIFDCRL